MLPGLPLIISPAPMLTILSPAASAAVSAAFMFSAALNNPTAVNPDRTFILESAARGKQRNWEGRQTSKENGVKKRATVFSCQNIIEHWIGTYSTHPSNLFRSDLFSLAANIVTLRIYLRSTVSYEVFCWIERGPYNPCGRKGLPCRKYLAYVAEMQFDY